MEGFINILKPPGMTSHDVVAYLRRTLREKKIGHCGTLDPEAAGVLPVCLGQATKLASFVVGEMKTYYCEMALGYETDTQDVWGAVTKVYDPVEEAAVKQNAEETLKSFIGEQIQETPAFSAVKKDGKSLHRYAREGKPIEGMTRRVTIHELDYVGLQEGRLRFIVTCSSGTYVRMICQDIGRKLGTGGVMAFLIRTACGPFKLADSFTLEDIKVRREHGDTLLKTVLIPKERLLSDVPALAVSKEEAQKIRQGQSLLLEKQPPVARAGEGRHFIWVKDDDHRLAALGYCESSEENTSSVYFKPEKTFK